MEPPERVAPPPLPAANDLLARLLEAGLAVLVIVAPLPFGAVGPSGRLLIEGSALVLGLVWLLRSLYRAAPLPTGPIAAGMLGLLALASLQAVPLGGGLVRSVSPRSIELRRDSALPEAASRAEQSLLGTDPTAFDPPAAISVDPSATASALRNGVAMAALFLVAAGVAATRGIRRLAFCLLISGSFQGLYGLLVLASGYDHIWNRPKLHYLEAATGTFVNKNHFACFVAMTLCCGLGLLLDDARRRPPGAGRRAWVQSMSEDGSRRLLWGLLLVVGLAGMLLSLSRAGIAVGLGGLLVTWAAATRGRSLRTRAVVALLVVAAASLPLLQLGTERLVERYTRSTFDLTKAGSRGMVWGDTLDIALAFPVAGCGFGTFATVYPVFRSPEVRLFYAHAHNDPLQVLAEGGVIGAGLLLLILVPLAVLVARALAGDKGIAAIGFAAALLAVLLHSVVDFDFRIPANAALAAILAGALYGLPWTGRP